MYLAAGVIHRSGMAASAVIAVIRGDGLFSVQRQYSVQDAEVGAEATVLQDAAASTVQRTGQRQLPERGTAAPATVVPGQQGADTGRQRCLLLPGPTS